jgi:hypothetical protein
MLFTSANLIEVQSAVTQISQIYVWHSKKFFYWNSYTRIHYRYFWRCTADKHIRGTGTVPLLPVRYYSTGILVPVIHIWEQTFFHIKTYVTIREGWTEKHIVSLIPIGTCTYLTPDSSTGTGIYSIINSRYRYRYWEKTVPVPAVLRIRDDLSRIRIRPLLHPGSESRIRRVKKHRIADPTYFCIKAINKFCFLIPDPGSRSDHCSIPDPGGKKAPDPGSGSATLGSRLNVFQYLFFFFIQAKWHFYR